MVFGFGYKSFASDPSTYASPRKASGSPPTRQIAEANLKGYDYIIIGVGTAGSILASRLSEDQDVTVLGLEAGADSRNILATRVPAMWNKLLHGPNDYNYYTVEQPHVGNRSLYWPRAKMVGGCSAMNAMMHHHNSHSDFDEWETKYGCTGWAYKDIHPYMRKVEKYTPNPNRPLIDNTQRGDSGLWHIGYSYLTEVGEKGFLGACEEIGIPHRADINTPDGTLGCCRIQTFIDPKGQRSSSATAYLTQKVVDRTNLTIATGAFVTRIIFDVISDKTPRAIGVQFQTERDGPFFEVFARKEVILCGGAINTPQTLLLSGIGPRAEIEKHGITFVKELDAVGKRLKDHFCATPILCKTKPGVTCEYLKNDLKALPSLLRWLLNGTGPLSSNVSEVACFLRSADPPFPIADSKPVDHGSGKLGPDLEIIQTPLVCHNHGEDAAPPNSEAISLTPIGLRPQSHGTITLRTASPFDHPNIDPKYWSDEGNNDMRVLAVGLRVCIKLMQSQALAKYLAPVEPNDDVDHIWWPYSSSNPDAVDPFIGVLKKLIRWKITEEELLRYMKRISFTLYHPVGSARMGPDAQDSVVDLQCRVHGVAGLRVIDASVFPEQSSGHPTSPIFAIAEKMADSIRGRAPSNSDASKTEPIAKDVPLPARQMQS